jgi:prepilin-type N-terminal cleavage/methylation domain-containing protein
MAEVTDNLGHGSARPARRAPAGKGRRATGGFSLVELLLAVMILGVGLTMVASVFPVGATWTRQTAEETVGGIVARNAVAIIQAKYNAGYMAGIGSPRGSGTATVVPLPGIGANSILLPLVERAYDFGRGTPYPAANPVQALYYWTALVRRSNASLGPATGNLPDGMLNSFDVYILVFKKGAVEQTFTNNGSEYVGTRDPSETGVPYVATLQATPLSGNQVNLQAAAPSGLVGSQVIEGNSGTVYRVIGVAGNVLTLNGPAPTSLANLTFWYVPPANGTSVSPLVYVYQTTIAF